ncbi:MAG: peptide chain release factor N(5)-glutamine methyltransferase [Magnetospirillum sp.]|nr:peptide chain release factor N(5)-glutamine methyltransferase [Magnetospirillum sp.]
MTTFGAAVADLTARLAAAGVDEARLDARLLVAEAAGVGPGTVFTRPETPLTSEQTRRLAGLAARREAREPMSHVLGRRGFWTLDLKVTAATLAPRGDTETVVEAVLAALPERSRPRRILDLGTGTGCLVLALLSEFPEARGLGIDASPAALEVARENAALNRVAGRVDFNLGDWGRGVDGCFDAIVSNPPYIPDDVIAGLAPEVARFEPRLALAGGADGLDCYRALLPDAARLLAPGGVVALEVGEGQSDAVAAIGETVGLSLRGVRNDLAGIARCVIFGPKGGA